MYLVSTVSVLFLSILVCLNASPTDQRERRPIVDMIGSDLRTTELSERMALIGTELTKRIADFEKQYIQRIAVIETKLDLFSQEKGNNNALEVAAEMMKVVLEIQKQIGNLETKLGQKCVENQQELENLKSDVDKLNQTVNKHNEEIKNTTIVMLAKYQERLNDHALENNDIWTNISEIRQLMHQHHEQIQNVTDVMIQNRHDVSTELMSLSNTHNVYENQTMKITECIEALVNKQTDDSTCIFSRRKGQLDPKGHVLHRVIRFENSHSNGWSYSSSLLDRIRFHAYNSWGNSGSNPDRIRFMASKDVYLHGVILYGDERSSKYNVVLEIKDERDNVISSIKTNYTSSSPDYMSDILLETPVRIYANKQYKVIALISGPFSNYGSNGLTSVTFNNITITFSRDDGRSNSTSEKLGQIPGLLLSN